MKKNLAKVAIAALLMALIAVPPALGEKPPVPFAQETPPITAPFDVLVTEHGFQVAGFLMAAEPVDGGHLMTVGYAGGPQVSWVDGVEPIPPDALTLTQGFIETPEWAQFAAAMAAGSERVLEATKGDRNLRKQIGAPPVQPPADSLECAIALATAAVTAWAAYETCKKAPGTVACATAVTTALNAANQVRHRCSLDGGEPSLPTYPYWWCQIVSCPLPTDPNP